MRKVHEELPPLHSGTFMVGWSPYNPAKTGGLFTIMPKYAELTGKRFHHLTVLGPVRSGLRMSWQCQCDCGRILDIRTRTLTVEKRKTCAHRDCIYYKAMLAGYGYKGEVPLSHLHTAEEAKSMMQQPCNYCGNSKYMGLLPGVSKLKLIPVCMKCRKMRGEMSHLDFISQIKLISTVQRWSGSRDAEIV